MLVLTVVTAAEVVLHLVPLALLVRAPEPVAALVEPQDHRARVVGLIPAPIRLKAKAAGGSRSEWSGTEGGSWVHQPTTSTIRLISVSREF